MRWTATAQAAVLANLAAVEGRIAPEPGPLTPIKILDARERADCSSTEAEDDAIVVCGRRSDDRYRLPPLARPPSIIERTRHDPNSLRPPGCGAVLSDRNCTALTPVAGIAFGYRRPPIVIVDWSRIPDPPPRESE